MKIIAFDTSSTRLSAAVYDESKVLALYESDAPVRHSETLAPILHKLLKKARLSPEKIDCVAVGLGPGSFTGLRIAVTTAKVLAYALKARLIGVSSLEAAARTRKEEGKFAVLVDAKKSQVYAAVYQRKNGQFKTLRKPVLVDREAFLRGPEKDIFKMEFAFPSAAGIVEGTLDRIREKKWDDPFLLEPLYLHPKDCNVAPKTKK